MVSMVETRSLPLKAAATTRKQATAADAAAACPDVRIMVTYTGKCSCEYMNCSSSFMLRLNENWRSYT